MSNRKMVVKVGTLTVEIVVFASICQTHDYRLYNCVYHLFYHLGVSSFRQRERPPSFASAEPRYQVEQRDFLVDKATFSYCNLRQMVAEPSRNRSVQRTGCSQQRLCKCRWRNRCFSCGAIAGFLVAESNKSHRSMPGQLCLFCCCGNRRSQGRTWNRVAQIQSGALPRSHQASFNTPSCRTRLNWCASNEIKQHFSASF